MLESDPSVQIDYCRACAPGPGPAQADCTTRCGCHQKVCRELAVSLQATLSSPPSQPVTETMKRKGPLTGRGAAQVRVYANPSRNRGAGPGLSLSTAAVGQSTR
jgi:hypothetical protein